MRETIEHLIATVGKLVDVHRDHPGSQREGELLDLLTNRFAAYQEVWQTIQEESRDAE